MEKKTEREKMMDRHGIRNTENREKRGFGMKARIRMCDPN